jgi:hypothetical protein
VSTSDYSSRLEPGELLERFHRELQRRDLAEVVQVIAGFFCDTLAQLPIDAVYAFIHIDVDLYHSTFAFWKPSTRV